MAKRHAKHPKRSGYSKKPKNHPKQKRSSGSRNAVLKSKMLSKIKGSKIRDKVIFEIPHYPQTENFTSSAACAMMILKYINPDFRFKKEYEYSIWQEAVNGSVWHGSKYGLAYALARRGAKVGILSNTKDEGYERKIAVYENVNLDTLSASFTEIRNKALSANIEEEHNIFSIQTIKKALSANYIPIVLIDANFINPYLESSPHWVVVKGYDKDAFYINDPYSDSTITLDPDAFKSALGYDQNMHMIVIDSKFFSEKGLS